MRRIIIYLIVAVISVSPLYALGPHEIALIVNKNSADSIAVAAYYSKLRSVPEINIVRVDIPEGSDDRFSVSRSDFTEKIWKPVNRELEKRGLNKRILAWVYSTDFPCLVETKPAVSIQGLTFLRNKLLEKMEYEVGEGRYLSPLYAGRSWKTGLSGFSQTFDSSYEKLKDNAPLPSMLLGYTGKHGNSIKEVKACLKRGCDSDGSRPDDAVVYFVTGTDVRATTRNRQFPAVVRELARRPLTGVVVDREPSGMEKTIGILMGAVAAKGALKNTFLNGAVGDHLTSHGGNFKTRAQMKLTDWIKAGTTAASGTVTEPMSIWSKFPHASFYLHYSSGCTIIESYYLSTASPLQIIFVGDPLASPWKTEASVRLASQEQSENGDELKLEFYVKANLIDYYSRFLLLVDGKVVSKTNSLTLKASDYKGEEEHRIMAVAYKSGMVRCQAFKELRFRVSNGRITLSESEKK